MLTAETLRDLLNYAPETGEFTWRVSRGSRKAGDAAGSTREDGYVVIRLLGVLYLAHQLAWLHAYGAWPESGLDHRDLNPSNNALMNLRPATQSQNLGNTRAHRDNTTGLKGVSRCTKTGRFRARIYHQGKEVLLGLFDTPEDAHSKYQRAAKRLRGEFGRAA